MQTSPTLPRRRKGEQGLRARSIAQRLPPEVGAVAVRMQLLPTTGTLGNAGPHRPAIPYRDDDRLRWTRRTKRSGLTKPPASGAQPMSVPIPVTSAT